MEFQKYFMSSAAAWYKHVKSLHHRENFPKVPWYFSGNQSKPSVICGHDSVKKTAWGTFYLSCPWTLLDSPLIKNTLS
jgi:hypothetical protein